MLDAYQRLRSLPFFEEAAASVALLAGVLALLAIARAAIRSGRLARDARRRWLVSTRNAALLALLMGLVVIWGTEVRSFALSFVAAAAAVVIAAKELLVCLSGTFLRTSSGAFELGDRIEVNGVRGDVIDLGAFTTTLLEVGTGHSNRTGRAITIPNSVFTIAPVYNETPSGEYLLTTMAVPVGPEADLVAAEAALLAAAAEECRPFLDAARARLAESAAHKGLDPSTVDPRVSVRLVDPTRTELLVRFPAPVRLRNRVEQSVLHRYLGAVERRPAAGDS